VLLFAARCCASSTSTVSRRSIPPDCPKGPSRWERLAPGSTAGVRQVVATIDGRPRQAGDRYTISNQTPRPAAVASEMGQQETSPVAGSVAR
jgi:hypothetical protein